MNAYCELYIYKNSQIQPQRNFKVDDIEDYLLTLDTYNRKVANVPVAIKGQFMKNQLKLTYKVVFEQGTITSFSSQSDLSYETTFNYNYLKAVNVDTRATQTGNLRTATPVYYFIVNKRWTSQNALELELEMDVVNTMLKDIDTNSPFTRKSFIVRRHKNRWAKVSGEVNKYSPIIDYVSEGINPLLFKKRECPLYYQKENGEVDTRSWYLIYRSQTTNDDSPIDIMACCDEGFITAQGILGYNGTKDVKKELKKGTWFIYGADGVGTPPTTNVGASVSFTDKNGSHTLTITSPSECIAIGTDNIVFGTVSNNGLYVEQIYQAGVFRKFRNVDFRKVYACRKTSDELYYYNPQITIPTFTDTYILSCSLDTSFITTYTQYSICAIDDINRTDPKLLKIVKLPYPPFKLEIINNELIIPSGWSVRQAETEGGEIIFPEILLYSDSSLVNAFSTSFTPTSNYLTDFQPFEVFRDSTIASFGTAVLYDSAYETKLYHSDFYKQKIVYDSFTYDVNAELFKVSSVNTLNCELEFSITATMNSKMMFRIKGITNFSSYKSEVGDVQDYSGLLYIARNNELPVFNSAYLNYIRTGYNYDIKTKNRQLTSSIIGGVLSTIGSVASFASSAVSGPAGVAGGIGLATGATAMFSKAIFSTAQAEQNIAQKLKSSEMEGLSVAGSDDVDLMSIYTDENKLKYVRYEVSANMKEAISNLFYYCGYVANYNDYPDSYISSRMWFNFVQFDPAYVNDYNYPQELVDKLSEKCREGITFLHHNQITINNETIAKYWDFEQVYENWEVLS